MDGGNPNEVRPANPGCGAPAAYENTARAPFDAALNHTILVDVLNKLTHLPAEMQMVVSREAEQLARHQFEAHWRRVVEIGAALRGESTRAER